MNQKYFIFEGGKFMKKQEFSLTYGVGVHAKTKEYKLESDSNIDFINQQLKMSIPVLTHATIHVKMNHPSHPLKNDLYTIYIGKEFDIDTFLYHEENYSKYDISTVDILKLMMKGFTRFCLLNYKKYDQVIVGLKENDRVVTDYYALRTNINKMKKAVVN